LAFTRGAVKDSVNCGFRSSGRVSYECEAYYLEQHVIASKCQQIKADAVVTQRKKDSVLSRTIQRWQEVTGSASAAERRGDSASVRGRDPV